MSTKTIFDVYSDFEAASIKGNKLIVRSVMHRFLAEFWGGQAPQGSKATHEEVFKFLELIKSLPSILLVGSLKTLEQEFIKKEITKDNSKSYKSAYKAFIIWAKGNNYFLKPQKEIETKIIVKIFNRNAKGSGRKTKVNHGQIQKSTYALMATNSGNGRNSGKLTYEADYINDSLLGELYLFKEFRKGKHVCSDSTIKKDIKSIYQILGWLHRYKNIPLENLSLNLIVTPIVLNVSIDDFKNENSHQDFAIKKAIMRQNAIENANKNKKLIEEYLDFVGGHPKSKLIKLVSIIAIAKFIFRDQIRTDDYIDYSDLPIIKRLNHLHNNFSKIAKNTPQSVPHSKKTIPFKQAMDVLQILKLKADCLIRGCL